MITEKYPDLTMKDIPLVLESVSFRALASEADVDSYGFEADSSSTADSSRRADYYRYRAVRVPPIISDARLRFGGPFITEIDKSFHPEDADLQAFLSAKSQQYRWFLAHMAVTILKGDGPRLESAKVNVTLSDDGTPTGTIAYSVHPEAVEAPTRQAPTFTLNPTAAGISVGSVTLQPVRRKKIFLASSGVLSTNVSWTFTRLRSQPLEQSSTRLVMVISAPSQTKARSLSVSFSGMVRIGHFRHKVEPRVGVAPEMAPF